MLSITYSIPAAVQLMVVHAVDADGDDVGLSVISAELVALPAQLGPAL
jgi:hypothetical protein